jgi:hypothetical protein
MWLREQSSEQPVLSLWRTPRPFALVERLELEPGDSAEVVA